MEDFGVAAMKRFVSVIASVALIACSGASFAADIAARAPLFDAHLHYNADARARFPAAQAMAALENAGVAAVIATSTPNDGSAELGKAASRAITVIPFLRPYRTDADRTTWFNDPVVARFIDDELVRQPTYRGIGEFHLHGAAEAAGVAVKHAVDVAVARDLWLHAHCDEAALEAIFAHDPRVKVIWAHAGFTPSPAKIRGYLNEHPALMAELSYRTDIAPADKVNREWRALFADYPDRFLVGSDTWTNERWSGYGAIIDGYRRWLADLPRETATKLRWRNGARTFGVPAHAFVPRRRRRSA